jgi:hypothetical protein
VNALDHMMFRFLLVEVLWLTVFVSVAIGVSKLWAWLLDRR